MDLIKRDCAKLNSHLVVYNMHFGSNTFDGSDIMTDSFAWILLFNQAYFLHGNIFYKYLYQEETLLVSVVHDFCDGINIKLKIKIKKVS